MGDGYIDIIVLSDNYKSLIADLLNNGYKIKSISWWEWCPQTPFQPSLSASLLCDGQRTRRYLWAIFFVRSTSFNSFTLVTPISAESLCRPFFLQYNRRVPAIMFYLYSMNLRRETRLRKKKNWFIHTRMALIHYHWWKKITSKKISQKHTNTF